MWIRTIVRISKLGAGTRKYKGGRRRTGTGRDGPCASRAGFGPTLSDAVRLNIDAAQTSTVPTHAPRPVPRRGRRGADRRLAGRGRAGGGRAGAAARAGAGPLPRGCGCPRRRPRRPGAGDVHSGVPCGREVPRPVPVPHLAADDRGQRAEGRGAAVPTGAGRAARRRAALTRRRPARDRGGRRDGGAVAGRAGAAAAYAAGGVPAPRAAGPGVRGDRRCAGHVARRGPGALSPRRQTPEGVPAVNMDEELQDGRLRELARLLGAGAAERLDVEPPAQAVCTRLRQQPRVTVGGWVSTRVAWLNVAAAIVLVLGAGLVTRGLLRERVPTAAVGAPLGEDLSDLTADQLRETVGALEQPFAEESPGGLDAGLESLNTAELRALLRTLES